MTTSEWLADAVSNFGSACAAKLAGPGDAEAAIRSPLEHLLRTVGAKRSIVAEFYDEVRDTERQVRPDYGVSVNGAITGYVEVKAPGKSIDPKSFTAHDKRQWDRQKDLPNLLYTNGTEWRLYRDTEPVGEPVRFAGGTLYDAGAGLQADRAFEQLIFDFLDWKPAPITSVNALVSAVAPLTRLLRGEVLDQISAERRAVAGGAHEDEQPFLGLSFEWRSHLFPQADDDTFADGYAQTVTFALLMARTENINVTGVSLAQIGDELKAEHSLMGRALQLLTIDVATDFKVTLDLLTRVVGAVQWERIRRGRRDLYLHLYEHFLEEYDNSLRKESGSYYTPREVVEEMVRLTEDALATRLGKSAGFADPSVLTIDPAMGTGTYLHTILDHVAEQTEAHDGEGAIAGALAQAAKNLVGFELQMGPYTVAELRLSDLLRLRQVDSAARPRLFVTDTLDDPHAVQAQLAGGLSMIAASRKRANEIKAGANVTVVIGNPPYRQDAEGMGGWVEAGSGADGKNAHAILDDWRDPESARHGHNLKNLYVYFWRWATWKVFESTPQLPDGDAGIVCFITTSGYVRGPGFTAMRRYLREWASEGWVIDVTPEGQTPDVNTRIFPGVRQPLAIALFVRQPDKPLTVPAVIRHRSISGRQSEKFGDLSRISLDGEGWQEARSEWSSPLTPAAEGQWDDYPALGELFPWVSPGVAPHRRWVYAPSPGVLEDRWRAFMSEPDDIKRKLLFKETRDRTLTSTFGPLPGISGPGLDVSIGDPRAEVPAPVRIAYRSFDRQWTFPDRRLNDMPRPDLWEAQLPGQVFITELHADAMRAGPALAFTALIPDNDHFNNRGGRVLPLKHPDGTFNLAPGLVPAIRELLGREVTGNDVLAYVAGVVAHPAFVNTFGEELRTPGVRVPITDDPDLWDDAVKLGEVVLWCHSYGEAFSGADRSPQNVRFSNGDPRRPLARKTITGMPQELTYDAGSQTLHIGSGTIAPVPEAVWNFEVGGRRVVKSWFDYRKASPGGKKTSPLDHMHVSSWDPSWTSELLDLVTVLTRLSEMEPAQEALLAAVLQGGVLTRDQLLLSGVQWPAVAADRRPKKPLVTGDDKGLDFTSIAGEH